jgi:23S rRNA pseudouridine1911/1915/1917 synthase
MKIIHLTTTVPPELANTRFDSALAKLFPQYSRSRWQAWIKAGAVQIDDKAIGQSEKVQDGQQINVNVELAPEELWQAQAIPLNIVYEDEDIIVINKPVGLVVHPGKGNQENTLVNALLHYAPELANVPRAGVVHRLDKDTSGLLVIARNLTAHKNLVTQIQNREMKREYFAIVSGILISGSTIRTAIGRHPLKRTKMAVTPHGKGAVTHYRVVEKFTGHTYLKVQLETGRTHQIRVHMAHIHHPIVGDPVYGGRLKFPANISAELRNALQHFKRQALHATALTLQHPTTGKILQWQAPLPDDMQQLLTLLRKK